MIGLIGLAFDQLLAYLAQFLFPWQPKFEGGGLIGWAARRHHLLSPAVAGRPPPGRRRPVKPEVLNAHAGNAAGRRPK